HPAVLTVVLPSEGVDLEPVLAAPRASLGECLDGAGGVEPNTELLEDASVVALLAVARLAARYTVSVHWPWHWFLPPPPVCCLTAAGGFSLPPRPSRGGLECLFPAGGAPIGAEPMPRAPSCQPGLVRTEVQHCRPAWGVGEAAAAPRLVRGRA